MLYILLFHMSMCCKIRRRGKKLTRSECLVILTNLRNRIFSRIAAFKFVQLVLASAGMSLHVCQPVHRSLMDSSLLPGVLGAFVIISAVLLIGHSLNFTAPARLNATFSIIAALAYGWCMSAVMDSLRTEEDTTSWTFGLGKGVVCFAALAIHLLELLHAFINRDTRPLSLRSSAPSQSLSRSESSQPTQL